VLWLKGGANIMVEEIWSDLHHGMILDAQGSIKKVINIDAVKTSLDNILRTRKGERVMRPDFGSDLYDLIFEPISQDVFDLIIEEIRRDIEIWDNRIVVQSMGATGVPDRNEVNVKILFSIRGYEEVFQFNTNLIGGL
jgi:phage baseplate assembly protein W